MNKITKPKLVFFQWIDKGAAKFYSMHKLQHVKCLSEFFDVTVISNECDYQQICDKYQPDITLFESGIAAANSHRRVANTSVYPEIPKLGFYNGDPFCGWRSVFLSDMEHWDIQTFFTISVPLAEYMPEISESIFTWPNFIMPDLYKDYKQPKVIPILFTGSRTSLYPWRQRIQNVICRYYPSLISPHLGYSEQTTSRMIYGEQYARMINSSWFVPACGMMSKEVVRKHFEIPACKSCLITEKTPALEAAGFIDMQNCVFADETDVLDKIDYLFQNPEEFGRITNAGYQLVHSQHTLKQRDQILQWFHLNKILKSGQKIVQKGPFGGLTIVEESSGIKNSHIIVNGLDRVLLQQGDEKLWTGKYDAAETLYLSCLNYRHYIPEPKLRLAICNLYRGNAVAALHWIVQPLQWSLVYCEALDPDPVEWAYFIITLLCQGKLNEARLRAHQFSSLCHPELEYTRWVINVLENSSNQIALPNINLSKCRISVQQLPDLSLNEWVDRLSTILTACKQPHFAQTLHNTVFSVSQISNTPNYPYSWFTSFLTKYVKKTSKKLSNLLEHLLASSPKLRIKFYNLKITAYPFHIILFTKLIAKLKQTLLKLLNRLEAFFGFFLPYSLSTIKNDEFFSSIENSLQGENIKTSLLIGASSGESVTEAFLEGIRKNPNKPTAFCINLPTPRFLKLIKYFSHNSYVKCHAIYSDCQQGFLKDSRVMKLYNFLATEPTQQNDFPYLEELDCLHQDIEYIQKLRITENAINIIKQENHLDYFDLILIDKSEFDGVAELDELYRAKFILLDDINTIHNYNNYHKLLAHPNYTLVTHNTSLRNGYAIFEKVNNEVISQSVFKKSLSLYNRMQITK